MAAPSAAHGTLVYRQAPSEEFACALCLEAVAEEPSSLRACDHVFCRACLLRALRSSRRCPTCRVALEDTPIRCLGVQQEIARLPAACA